MTQAVNTDVVIESDGDLSLLSHRCYEADLSANQTGSIFSIDFKRISNDITCSIQFTSNNRTAISAVIISSDGTRGWEYRPFGNGQAISSDKTRTSFTTLEKIQTPIYIVLVIAFIGLLAELSVFALSIHRSRTSSKRAKREQEVRGKEVTDELFKLNEMLALYASNINVVTDPAMREFWNNRIARIEQDIIEKEIELDEVKTKLAVEENLYESIGKFFTKWAGLESALRRLAMKHQIEFGKRANISQIVRELQAKRVLSPAFVDIFVPIRNFRNEVIHGQLEKEALENESHKISTGEQLKVFLSKVFSTREVTRKRQVRHYNKRLDKLLRMVPKNEMLDNGGQESKDLAKPH